MNSQTYYNKTTFHLLSNFEHLLTTFFSVSLKPTVKILKRPTLQQNNRSTTEAKPKAPMKSLRQREHEYAQARLRILGAAKSPEEMIELVPFNPFD